MVKTEMVLVGPWQILVAVKNVMCSDGRRRRARVTSQPDTFFTVPASVCVKGKTVSGFLMHWEGEQRFFANSWGKNSTLLPD